MIVEDFTDIFPENLFTGDVFPIVEFLILLKFVLLQRWETDYNTGRSVGGSGWALLPCCGLAVQADSNSKKRVGPARG